jgi:ribonuclease P protein component
MQTITSKREFSEVYSQGRRVNHKLARMTILSVDETISSRIAFVAPKRLGNAVFRNRCKRVLREAVSLCHFPQNGLLVIIFATRTTHKSHPHEVACALTSLLAKAGF